LKAWTRLPKFAFYSNYMAVSVAVYEIFSGKE